MRTLRRLARSAGVIVFVLAVVLAVTAPSEARGDGGHGFGGGHGFAGSGHPGHGFVHHGLDGHHFHPGVHGRVVVPVVPFYGYYPYYPYDPYAYGNPGYWYYCPSYGAYYPNVGSCPEPWVTMPA